MELKSFNDEFKSGKMSSMYRDLVGDFQLSIHALKDEACHSSPFDPPAIEASLKLVVDTWNDLVDADAESVEEEE